MKCYRISHGKVWLAYWVAKCDVWTENPRNAALFESEELAHEVRNELIMNTGYDRFEIEAVERDVDE